VWAVITNLEIVPMVAHAHCFTPAQERQLHEKFLSMLPQIRNRAEFALRGLRRQLRDELIDEIVADTFVWFRRLAERGRLDLAFATPLTNFSIRRVLGGRRVGCSLNRDDVSSYYGQRSNNIRLLRLDRYDAREHCWRPILVEDRNAGPAEVAAAKIDFEDWFRRLPRRDRRIAARLAVGDRTRDVAKRFGLSPGRISQLRKAFRHSWAEFQGEDPELQPVDSRR
jgi:hypothetical protein